MKQFTRSPFSFSKFQRTIFAKTNFFGYSLLVFVFVIIGANFSEARVRRNSSPQPPPSAAPERSGQKFFSKWVRAIFRISHSTHFAYSKVRSW
ncbi:MAG: hypothetical protein A2655_00010 [Candidatus Yanofskybacteria bacterium RIFCSPHIGHO2_01_FULL_43_42]|nr:MAG: hypothetical protein A2655_00010 [Candidatus Yanofskybacteria bacterium RIFCSPHIGHO2_01_FULL_43_42]OGN12535.1 MAG: hypothetical protein A3D48_04345 [Candidatus Yanofskybacteria bacterium RIFCSPHIGHO2_02_FULL_43_17]